MTPDEQTAEWAALVEWVVWIHDLYELDREERLPRCWPQHPGLVEELRSLKAWRTAIYGSPDAAGAAHTARSWHGELRQTIHAAMTFWAPGCRVGHHAARLLADAHPNLPEQWRQTRPPVMASSPPPPAPTAAGAGQVGQLTHEQMNQALRTGRAQQHSRAIAYYAKLDGSWWTRSTDGATWLRCTEPGHHARLEDTSARLRAADIAAEAVTDQLHHGKE